jgi:hypothetical protein
LRNKFSQMTRVKRQMAFHIYKDMELSPAGFS